jgi:hypothetical protein
MFLWNSENLIFIHVSNSFVQSYDFFLSPVSIPYFEVKQSNTTWPMLVSKVGKYVTNDAKIAGENKTYQVFLELKYCVHPIH